MDPVTDASGLASLLERHAPEIRRFLSARCGDADLAEDLMQELWIKASSQAAGPVANGRAYLFRMANNLVLDHRRGQQRAMARDRQWIAEAGGNAAPELRPDPAMPADEALVAQEEAKIIQDAIAGLPPGAQRALRLHRIDGHSQAEVAQIMGISVSGVEKHLALAMKHLRRHLVDCGLIIPAASKGREAPRGGEPRVEQTYD